MSQGVERLSINAGAGSSRLDGEAQRLDIGGLGLRVAGAGEARHDVHRRAPVCRRRSLACAMEAGGTLRPSGSATNPRSPASPEGR